MRAKYDYPGRAASNFVGGHHETPLPVQETPGTEVNCHVALTDVPFYPISNLTSLSLAGQMEVVETNVKGEKKKIQSLHYDPNFTGSGHGKILSFLLPHFQRMLYILCEAGEVTFILGI